MSVTTGYGLVGASPRLQKRTDNTSVRLLLSRAVGGPVSALDLVQKGISLVGELDNAITRLAFPRSVDYDPAAVTLAPSDVCTFNSALYVGGSCATDWGSGDIGAQINAAYAALPSTGGTIYILPESGCYNFSTPVLLNTVGKPAALVGVSPANPTGGTCLNYLPTTTTTAITLDYTLPIGAETPVPALTNIYLLNNSCGATTIGGCGSSAVGVTTGGTNGGAFGARFSNSTIEGFGTAINLADARGVGWAVEFDNFVLRSNTVGLILATLHENTHWFGGVCIANGTCIVDDTGSDVYLYGVSIDSNAAGLAGNFGHYHCIGCHFENLGLTTLNFVNLTGGYVDLVSGYYLDNLTSGTIEQMFTLVNAVAHISGITIFTTGRTITNLFNLSGASTVSGDYFTSVSSLIPNICNTGSVACTVTRNVGGALPALNQMAVFEGANPIGVAGYDICYGDSAAHSIKCSFNSDSFSALVRNRELATVAISGSYNDLSNKPTIFAPQINSDWNATSGVAQILNKPATFPPADNPTFTTVTSGTLKAGKVNATAGLFISGGTAGATGGTYLAFNAGSGTGETDFISNMGTGSGGFNFYITKSTQLSAPIATLNSTGLTVGALYETNPYTPPAASTSCKKGQIAWDSSYVYVCVATNSWKRAVIAAW
ncbi:MAG: hypothetical protein WCF26_21985 [Candidatus Sulfotelmatobacter sp.]